MWEVFKLWASKVWTIIRPSVMVWLTGVGQQLLDLALEIVTDLATSDLSNSEKRDTAFDKIKEKLVEEGKEVGDSLINLAIEIAVTKIKSKL